MVSSIDSNSSQVSVAEVLKQQQQSVEQQKEQVQIAKERQNDIQEQQRVEQNRANGDRRGTSVDEIV